VQGAGAAAEIAQAIRAANKRAEVDVLIVARGGGSIEDLWAFNEEIVAQAVFESALPVVSGVGHETDFTICDFVADVRAATPTAAATLVVPDRQAVLRHVAGFAARWHQAQRRMVETRMQRVDGLARRLVHPAARLAQQRRDMGAHAQRLARAARQRLGAAAIAVSGPAGRLAWQLRLPLPPRARLQRAHDAITRLMPARLERIGARLAALEQNLSHLNPQAVLERGYAIVATGEGAIVQDAAQVAAGDRVALTFARGTAGAIIDAADAGPGPGAPPVA